MVTSVPEERVSEVRGFNRFFTRRIGVLRETHLESPYSLTEVRVLYEIAHGEGPTAGTLGRDLDLDRGYLSRILATFERAGLIARTPSPADGRVRRLALTDAGRAAVNQLEQRSDALIGGLLADLSDEQQLELLASMRAIRRTWDPDESSPRIVLRTHEPGDIGWIVHRHAVLYAREYGFDASFEALVAEIGARFLRAYDPRWERCWIAERDGHGVGSVMLVREHADVARLRLLLVEPSARGLGVGGRLVDECVRFARAAGYQRITLWTQSILHAAHRLYERAGFVLVKEEPHQRFGPALVGQEWEVAL
jgi:DNA-binding MarR family transcriptional regulator/GNAT superfamily N-acetyltransferase